jgi:hypothetical protein
VTYYVQRSSNFKALPQFLTIQSNILGQAGTTSYTDTNAVGSGPFFYRVGAGTPPMPTVRCVDLNCTNPVPPYIDWTTAATNIQDAIDVANPADVVVVTNGVYQTGGYVVQSSPTTLSNRVAVTKEITVKSVNGAVATTIRGYEPPPGTDDPADWHPVNCAYLTTNALLIGFTLTDGHIGVNSYTTNCSVRDCVIASNYAGGALCGTLYNCLLIGNTNSCAGAGCSESMLNDCMVISNCCAANGGGAFYSSLDRCTLAGNLARMGGGAAASSTLNNCLVISNRNLAGPGGGLYWCTAVNSTIVGNSISDFSMGAGTHGSLLTNCILYYNSGGEQECSPLPPDHCCVPHGFSPTTVTNEPLFINPLAGDFRLQSNSPCINAGNNSSVTSRNDLDGNPRISGGTVDIGAYEFQNPSSTISFAWLQQYGLPTDGSADFIDTDHDGLSNWQEWRAGTSPVDSSSVLKMLSLTNDVSGTTVSWQSVAGVNYSVERSDLTDERGFSTTQTNILGQSGTTSFTDTNGIGAPRLYYRARVE